MNQKSEKFLFLIVALGLLGLTLFFTYQTNSGLFGTIFCVVLLMAAAFYLFQFGSLSEFTLEALSAKASFIRRKAREAEQDADLIKSLKEQSEKATTEFRDDLKDLDKRVKEATETADDAKILGIMGQ